MSHNESPSRTTRTATNPGALPARQGVEYINPEDVSVIDPNNPADLEQMRARDRQRDRDRRAEQTVVNIFDQLHQATEILLQGSSNRRTGFRAKAPTQSSNQRHRRHR